MGGKNIKENLSLKSSEKRVFQEEMFNHREYFRVSCRHFSMDYKLGNFMGLLLVVWYVDIFSYVWIFAWVMYEESC